MITLSGLAVIAAISMVGFFLLWITLPLFLPAQIAKDTQPAVVENKTFITSDRFLYDEQQTMALAINPAGEVTSYHLGSGQSIRGDRLVAQPLVGFSLQKNQPNWVAISNDGKLFWGKVEFTTDFVNEASADLPDIKDDGKSVVQNGKVWVRTPEGQWRRHDFTTHTAPPIDVNSAKHILAITHSPVAGRFPPMRVAWIQSAKDSGLETVLVHIDQETNLLTGETKTSHILYRFLLPPLVSPPQFIQLSDLGDQIFIGLKDATLLRLSARDPENIFLAETFKPFNNETLTTLEFLIGKATLLMGTANGTLLSAFLVSDDAAETLDGRRLLAANVFPGFNSPISHIDPSQRSRVFSANDADGNVILFHATTAENLAKIRVPVSPILSSTITPKNDAIWVATATGFYHYALDLKHPEVGFRALFFPVHYEGYKEPKHVWQSSSGSDDSEPKLGVVPLIFGTLKATFYSLLFGVPLALLAAVYTSEFLHKRFRSKVKPAIELMASLPSVVLGFLAASVFSPWIEHHLAALLLSFVFVPGFLLLFSYVWKFLPYNFKKRLFAFRMPFIAVMIFFSLWMSQKGARSFEILFFSGNLKLWLGHQIGDAFGGWVYLLMPLGLCLGILSSFRFLSFLSEEPFSLTTHAFFKNLIGRPILIDVLKFTLGLVFSGVFTLSLAFLLDLLGFDPRGVFVGTYVQRNALVVGFVMGFAIIPIIYTLAEDALSMVPDHLRTASLGAGATVWQTTRYIVIPAATGGIFSAIMIGLGRAVGETMIVLMAAGNTPILSWDIFNGFRTLSANIAVELPEAVKNSTHYRTLFLSALILFGMTFMLNMLAEWVRQKFRKRVSQL